jgi:spermidine synthase
MLAHGTTLHGAQAVDPRFMCRPLVYYAPETPIGQVMGAVRLAKPAFNAGVVGLGTGAVSAYTRPGDRLTFFEIDPLVVEVATDPKRFSYTTRCAKGRIDYVLGDARLTLARQPDASLDVLLIDAFSSDSVPAHLLTVEAMGGYLKKLKPDGLLMLHLSNRHLELNDPAIAAAHAAGGIPLLQQHDAPQGSPPLWESAEDVVLVGKSHQALARFEADKRWSPGDPGRARPWSDDYMNLIGAILGRRHDRRG